MITNRRPTGLLLASSSLYRRQQLEQLRLPFRWESPKTNEDQYKGKKLSPKDLSEALATAKACSLNTTHPDELILGGDQVCSIENEILNKPLGVAKAREQLKKLQGQEHQLFTSICFSFNGETEVYTEVATLKMISLSDDQITNYLNIDEPFYCCGSYRLEALGISLFEKILCQDHTSIIGLPLMKVSQVLRKYRLLV